MTLHRRDTRLGRAGDKVVRDKPRNLESRGMSVSKQYGVWIVKNAGFTSVPSAITSTTAPTAAPSPTTGSGNGLTTGAKAGIGVGVSIGVLSALAVLALVFRARRRRRRMLRQAQGNDVGSSGGKPELHNKDLPRTHGRSELSEQRAPVEMDAAEQMRKAELPGADGRVADLGEKETGTSTTEKSLEK